MKIGIIGAGQIGGTLTRRLRALGHEVHVANSRDPRTLASLVTETGAVAVEAKDAPRGVDLVIVTIPERNVPTLPKGLFAGVPASVVVVDTGNYYPRQRDGQIVEIESGMPESRWVEQKLGRSVIKAFNNIYARHLLERGRPHGSPGRIALPVAGDDAKAKAVVLQLVDELGFDAVDAGGLDDSWRQQPGTPVYTTDLDAEGVRKALSAARPQRTPDWTATPKSPGNFVRRWVGQGRHDLWPCYSFFGTASAVFHHTAWRRDSMTGSDERQLKNANWPSEVLQRRSRVWLHPA